MARPMRIDFPGALFHLTSRGNEKKRIYRDDQDRSKFLSILRQVHDRFHWHIYAYAMMPNHFHLLIELTEANLSRGMRHLNGVYTQAFNRRHHRAGHLFQGRFQSILVDKDSYLLELSRYISLNPVRAGLTQRAEDWPWSSYRATAGLVTPPAWLSVEWLLANFDSDGKIACTMYRSFVESGNEARFPEEELQGGHILGNNIFLTRFYEQIKSKQVVPEIPRSQKSIAQTSLENIFQQGARSGIERNASIYLAYVEHGHTMRAIGEYLGLHYVTVSRAIHQQEVKRRMS